MRRSKDAKSPMSFSLENSPSVDGMNSSLAVTQKSGAKRKNGDVKAEETAIKSFIVRSSQRIREIDIT